MTNIIRIARAGTTAEISRPDPAKVLEGDPVHSTWGLEERGNIYAGLWQSTPGAWRVSYEEWEYFNILEGHSVLTDADGTITQLKAGDRLVIRPGFVGIWRVIETTLKDYVIIT